MSPSRGAWGLAARSSPRTPSSCALCLSVREDWQLAEGVFPHGLKGGCCCLPAPRLVRRPLSARCAWLSCAGDGVSQCRLLETIRRLLPWVSSSRETTLPLFVSVPWHLLMVAQVHLLCLKAQRLGERGTILDVHLHMWKLRRSAVQDSLRLLCP